MARSSIEQRVEDLEDASPSSLENFANTDLTFDANRSHDTAGFDLLISTDGMTLAESFVYVTPTAIAIGAPDGIQFGGSIDTTFNSTGVGYTLDAGDHILNCTAGTFTVDLPTASGILGRQYIIKNSGSGVVTVDGDGTETIDGQTTIDLNQYDSITVVSDGTNWIII